jgi:hypothetical protein
VKPSVRRVQVRHWGLLAVATIGALVAGRPGPGGVLLGGGVMGLSVILYVVGFRLLIGRGGKLLAIGLLFVKLAALIGLGWLAFTAGTTHRPDPLGFALGVSCFPLAAVWEAMVVRER